MNNGVQSGVGYPCYLSEVWGWAMNSLLYSQTTALVRQLPGHPILKSDALESRPPVAPIDLTMLVFQGSRLRYRRAL